MKSDADDKLRQGQTVKEALDRCIQIARDRQQDTNPDGANREFALCITYLEEAQQRYTRGRAMQLGQFDPADLDTA